MLKIAVLADSNGAVCRHPLEKSFAEVARMELQKYASAEVRVRHHCSATVGSGIHEFVNSRSWNNYVKDSKLTSS